MYAVHRRTKNSAHAGLSRCTVYLKYGWGRDLTNCTLELMQIKLTVQLQILNVHGTYVPYVFSSTQHYAVYLPMNALSLCSHAYQSSWSSWGYNIIVTVCFNVVSRHFWLFLVLVSVSMIGVDEVHGAPATWLPIPHFSLQEIGPTPWFVCVRTSVCVCVVGYKLCSLCEACLKWPRVWFHAN